MSKYKFEFQDGNKTVTVEFEADTDAWSGYEGPMWQFFNFLKGCGYVFDVNTMIGVMKDNGDFTGAVE